MQELSGATKKVVNKNLLVEQIYDFLFDLLVKDELKPGTKLNIDGVSKQLGVSRSPVAAAFSALERDGFLKILPQNGTFVRELTNEELEAIYMARAALEKVVAPFVVEKVEESELLRYRDRFAAYQEMNALQEKELLELFELDLELHDFFAGFVPEIVRRAYCNICNLTRHSRLLNLKYEGKNAILSETINDNITIHIQIIDALRARKLAEAIDLLEMDVIRTKERVLNNRV